MDDTFWVVKQTPGDYRPTLFNTEIDALEYAVETARPGYSMRIVNPAGDVIVLAKITPFDELCIVRKIS